jgi:outer membrane protein assembly factor BamB
MLCFRNVNQIAILERETKSILWVWGEGELQWPHHPTMLDDGNILIFDNGVGREYSQVIEVDPPTGRIVWRYVGNPPQAFYSFSKGSAQRLPNGNTLICDSDNGRALEVTAEGETVWEWYNPAETEDGKRIVVYRMTRLSPESVEPLLYE